jgi:hypothetical protein
MADSFFLDPDEAKTLGNLDYMRMAKKVRKTYPTSKAWGAGFAEETQTSAMARIKPSSNGSAKVEDVAAFKDVEAFKDVKDVKSEVSERRRASSDLDMFRNMAKDIRKS